MTLAYRTVPSSKAGYHLMQLLAALILDRAVVNNEIIWQVPQNQQLMFSPFL